MLVQNVLENYKQKEILSDYVSFGYVLKNLEDAFS